MNGEITEYIPHSGKMVLIQEIIRINETMIECSINPVKSSHFCQKGGNLPSWIALEYMAQAIGAYVGWHDKQNGLAIKLGFLLGCRKLILNDDFFIENGSYFVEAELVFKDANLGSFKCIVYEYNKEKIIAEAVVNVYQPNDIEEFLKEQKR